MNINQKFNNITNNLINSCNKNFKDIIDVEYLFEHNIAIFIDIHTLLELRLINRSFKSIIFNSKTLQIFKPKNMTNIIYILKIFKIINSYNFKDYPIINDNFIACKYIKNIISNSLNVLILKNNDNMEDLITHTLSNTYSPNKIKELYLLNNFNIKTI